ncbi:hypothetical protein IEQ34_011054 [Dendrobium chrysotoxum]|uniref:Uncharacterized protein n=1 Tax=Dendrobium chrysotoxum TaxID=161865 RepID=A0AAV7GUK1_DENCH|nr:hypothetical protein IEQ34_011054 [Dendrobium chrysotoxum]
MLTAMTDMAENVDSILVGKKNEHKFRAGGGKDLKASLMPDLRVSERRGKAKKMKHAEQNPHTTKQYTPMDQVNQSSFTNIPECLTD